MTTTVLSNAILVNVFGIGLVFGLALGLFVMATIIRFMLRITATEENAE